MIHRDSAPLSLSKRHVSQRSLGTFAPSFIKSACEKDQTDTTAESQFIGKKYVWIRDTQTGFLRAWITSEKDGLVYVRCLDDTDRVVKKDETEKVNPPKFDKVQDMASLTYLNEPSVAYNLQSRFEVDQIYTYSGLFLVAVNPYRSLPIYGPDVITYFKTKSRDEMKPHVFATSDTAFRNLLEMRENQSILVTGESGAGKTESTKKVIQYLAAVANTTQSIASRGSFGNLEEQILQANPILEAFGNAQTVRNDNSSRFGKFIRIQFNDIGQITGACINWFLLEKSRVVHQTSKERNYHIFYQVLAGAPETLKSELLLDGSVASYAYLRNSRHSIPGVSDAVAYKDLERAFDVMRFSQKDQMDLFRIIAAILHIGNLSVVADRAEQARLPEPAQAERICHLLGIPVQEFTKALLNPRVKAGKEWVTSARTATQVRSSLAALSKTLYERNFGALVEKINNSMERSTSQNLFIGVLDMAGFEIFESNSFEQFCINYTNEKLQQFFNHHMFVLEQEEYAREQIDWKFIDFGLDLQPTIDLIEKSKPIGLLSCLDEECVMPKATDSTFTEKMHFLWKDQSTKYRPARFAKDGFVLTHYAAEVEYSTEGWLEKNKDPVNENVTKLLAKSTDHHVATLFADSGDNNSVAGRVKKGLFRTVAQRHKEQLNALMNQLNSTQPHFIRCIIPNHEKSPRKFDFSLVLDQLRCNGVLEGIRIARTGFPNRLPFSEFRQRYSLLASKMPKGFLDGQKATEIILRSLQMDPGHYRIGLSKVFFRAGVLAELEEKRETYLRQIFTKIQCTCRGFLERRISKKKLRQKDATLVIQTHLRTYLQLAESPWWQLFKKMKPILSATKSDRDIKLRSKEIVRLEALAKERELISVEATAAARRAQEDRKRLEDVLNSERALALDKEEIYTRSRQRETDLQEQLVEACSDIDQLEERCEELLMAKKKADSNVEQLMSDLSQGFALIENLKDEKDNVANQFAKLELSIEVSTAREFQLKQSKIESEQLLIKLRESLSQTEAKLHHSETKHSTVSFHEIEQAKEKVDRMQKSLTSLQAERDRALNQVANLVHSTSDLESLLLKKDAEVKEILVKLTATEDALEAAESESSVASIDIDTVGVTSRTEKLHLELEALRTSNSRLKEELAALQTVKVTSEAIVLLESQIATLKFEQSTAQHSRLNETSSYAVKLGEMAKSLEASNSNQQKLRNANEDLKKQILSKEEAIQQKQSEIMIIVAERRELTAERESLRTKLCDFASANERLENAQYDMQRQLHEAKIRTEASEGKLTMIEDGKEHMRLELAEMSSKFALLSEQRTVGAQETVRLMAELTQTQAKVSQQMAEHAKVKGDLSRSNAKLERVRKLDEDLVASQVRELQLEKTTIEKELSQAITVGNHVQEALDDLQLQKNRHSSEVEDLAQELEKEHQLAKTAEKMTFNLQSQLREARQMLEMETQQKLSAQTNVRQLQNSLDAAARDLTERTNQVLCLQKFVSDEDEVPAANDWQAAQKKVVRSVDLAQKLAAALTGKQAAEESRKLLEEQYAEARKAWSTEISLIDKRHNTSRRNLIDEVANLDISPSPKRLEGQPWAPPVVSARAIVGRTGTSPTLIDKFLSIPKKEDKGPSLLGTVAKLENELRDLEEALRRSEKEKGELTQRYQALGKGVLGLDPPTVKRLARENHRLHELLDDNADQMYHMGEVQRNDRNLLKELQSKSLEELEQTFQSLADSRMQLMTAQRSTLSQLESSKAETAQLQALKLELQNSVKAAQEALVEETSSRDEDYRLISQLQTELADYQVQYEAETIRTQELSESVNIYRERAEEYFGKLEQAEVTVIKATRSETFAKHQWKEAEDALNASSKERHLMEDYIIGIQKQLQLLEAKVDDGHVEVSELNADRLRFQRDLEQYQENRSQELEERDFSLEQTRQKYQRELTSLSGELELERGNAIKLRDDNRQIRENLETLQANWDEESLNFATWAKEKSRAETKLQDLTRAYEETSAAERDSQAQISSMSSQIRSLRGSMDELEAERNQLVTDKKTLELRLREASSQLSDSRIALKGPNLSERSDVGVHATLTDKDDLLAAMSDKLHRAELIATGAQRDILSEREANIKLHTQRVALENEKKELQLRIIDLETKSYTTSSKDVRYLQTKVQELQTLLQNQEKAKNEENRSLRSSDRTIKDLETALGQKDKARQRLEDTVNKNDNRIQDLKQTIEELQNSESAHQLAARRAEREARDGKERSLMLERELEKLKSRIEAASMVNRSNTMTTLNGRNSVNSSRGSHRLV